MVERHLIALALGATVPPALALSPCTPQTTRGAWMYACEGSLPTPAQTPVRILGTCTSSKSAFWTCEGTADVGGSVVSQALQGQANNLPNCTGTISYAQTLGGAPAGTLDIQYVIHDGGNAIAGLLVNTGGLLACRLLRIGSVTD